MKLFYTAVIALFINACGSTSKPFSRVDYIGSSFPVTDSVQVFVDPSAISKPYVVIGKGFMKPSAFGWQELERVQNDAVAKAKENGADAVLIQDYLMPSASYNTIVRTDSVGNSLLTLGNEMTSPALLRDFKFLFLKYK